MDLLLTFDNGYSPLLSLLTGGFEIWLAIWALRGPGRRRIVAPVAALLLALAGYQLLEVLACSRPESGTLATLAFVDIIWLPPLGLWLLYQYGGPERTWARRGAQGAFAIAGALSVWILVDPSFVSGTICSSMLASYQYATPWRYIYGAAYGAGLAVLIFGGITTLARSDDRVARGHTADLVMGVVAFVVPTLFVQLVMKSLDPSLPSIMCHFALALALTLWWTLRRERAL